MLALKLNCIIQSLVPKYISKYKYEHKAWLPYPVNMHLVWFVYSCILYWMPNIQLAILDPMEHVFLQVDIQTSRMKGKIPMVRVRNPWGNEAEWKGAWSDKSVPPLTSRLTSLVWNLTSYLRGWNGMKEVSQHHYLAVF